MKQLITAVLAACLSMAVAGSYAAEDAMKKDEMKKDGMKKDAMKKGDGMAKDDATMTDDDKKKKGKGKKDEMAK